MSQPRDWFLHDDGRCESVSVGSGTRIWAFAHVLAGARIGADCNICDHVFIEGDVVVGDRVTIKSGVQLWDGLRIQDDVFIGPNATFTNDPFPRSRQRPARFSETVIEQGASIGANATILPGITVGRGAMVGAGAVVTRSVPPHAIVFGNPARIRGYTRDGSQTRHEDEPTAVSARPADDDWTFTLTRAIDLRGGLAALEFSELPFEPRRLFAVFGVPSERVRGEHAHRRCHQALVCVQGRVTVVLDDGTARTEIVLDDPGRGLLIPPMVWATQYKFSADAVMIVLASLPYDPEDYIRDYGAFLAVLAAGS